MSVVANSKENKKILSSGRIHPKMFALLMGMASIVMMFSGLTSAYLVRKAAGNWVEFKIPEIFLTSTLVIVASSVVLHVSYLFLKKDKYRIHQVLLAIATVLGFAFIGLQYTGWMQMENIGIHLNGNPSGSFLYVISGIHALHIAGGLFFMVIYLGYSFFKNKNLTVNPVKQLFETSKPHRFIGMQLLLVYWHFVDVLWLYLYFFFQSQSA